MKSECKSIENHLIDDLDDALNSQERSQLANHLASCAECRDLQAQLKKAHAATSILRRQREALTMPIGLPVAIKQQLVPPRPFFRRPVWRYASVLTMGVLMIAVIMIYQSVMPGSQSYKSGVTTTRAALSGNSAENSVGQGITIDAAAAPEKSATKAGAQTAPVMATTAAATRTAGTDTILKQATEGFILYSGSLADLKPLQDYSLQPSSGSTSREVFLSALQESLAHATVLRVLTRPDAAKQDVLILAGYSQYQALKETDRIRASLRTDDASVTIEIIDPASHVRLIDLLGQTRYEQLLTSASERQLTYLLIMIGG